MRTRDRIILAVACVAVASGFLGRPGAAIAADKRTNLTMLNSNMPNLRNEAPPPADSDIGPAPMPNQDLYAPRGAAASSDPQFGPSIAPQQHAVVHPGAGWTTGSAFSDDLGRRHPLNALGVTPTWNMRVPLE